MTGNLSVQAVVLSNGPVAVRDDGMSMDVKLSLWKESMQGQHNSNAGPGAGLVKIIYSKSNSIASQLDAPIIEIQQVSPLHGKDFYRNIQGRIIHPA